MDRAAAKKDDVNAVVPIDLDVRVRSGAQRDALEVAKTGLAKMRAAVETALGR